jgi:ubiquinone/menaquinone biosynthesis C-methylase UbiE
MTKDALEYYNLVQKVYGNYVSFEENILVKLNNYNNSSSIIKVLEIGFGTGITTNIILKSRNDIKVYAIDNDPDTLKLASNNLSKWLNKNLVLELSDAIEYLDNIVDGYFDIIISGFTIHNFEKTYRENVYKAIYRVLVNKGLFINADKFTPIDINIRINSLKYRINKYIDVFLKANKTELLKEWISHYIDDVSYEKMMTIKETKLQLKNIGFNNIIVEKENLQEMTAILTAQK